MSSTTGNSIASEVAEVARLLVSDSGRMVNGNVVAISGGRGTFDIR